MHPMEDEPPTVFGHHVYVDPALAVDQLVAPDVIDVSIAVTLVLVAVVVEAVAGGGFAVKVRLPTPGGSP